MKNLFIKRFPQGDQGKSLFRYVVQSALDDATF